MIETRTQPHHSVLCSCSDIPDPGSLGFTIEKNDISIRGFIIHHKGVFFAYKNSCPHTGAPLEWVEHQFLDKEEKLIQCSMHGALFSINSGECLQGPCKGMSLQEIEIEVYDDRIFLLSS